MEYEIAAPRASALIESLRGVGYSTPTAIADLVDNSISAGARSVWIRFEFDGPESTISILDDGTGMDADELRRAMVVGSTSPLQTRHSADLGRFGLGLKTASFSQCRCLTVASRKNGSTTIRRWDLDYIGATGVDEWRLLTDMRSGSERHLPQLEELASGTLVIWENVDRLTAGTRSDDQRTKVAFLSVAETVEAHLGMVFHQFLGETGLSLRIFVGSRRVRPWDPFMRSFSAPTPTETISVGGGIVEIQGFVLPHKDQLSENQIRAGAGTEGWAAHQGFYVYRNRRMLVAGGWLGLGAPRVWTMEEPYRLARLRVEFGNGSDASWDIDVKKSVARPPRALRPRLTDLADLVRSKARKVFAHRGSYGARAAVVNLVPAWESAAAGGAFSYRINRKHPAIVQAIEAGGGICDAIEAALRVIEATVPVERIWLETAERGEVAEPKPSAEIPPALVVVGKSLVRHWTLKHGLTTEQALARLSSTDPFQNYPHAIADMAPQAD